MNLKDTSHMDGQLAATPLIRHQLCCCARTLRLPLCLAHQPATAIMSSPAAATATPAAAATALARGQKVCPACTAHCAIARRQCPAQSCGHIFIHKVVGGAGSAGKADKAGKAAAAADGAGKGAAAKRKLEEAVVEPAVPEMTQQQAAVHPQDGAAAPAPAAAAPAAEKRGPKARKTAEQSSAATAAAAAAAPAAASAATATVAGGDHDLALLRSLVSTHENFPSPGISFKDVFPIFADVRATRVLLTRLTALVQSSYALPDVVVGLDSRGFLVGPQMASALSAGFVPIRKAGKLPGKCHSVTYATEYSKATCEIQAGSIRRGARVLIVDDLLATGGTLGSAIDLVRQVGGVVVACVVIIELDACQGRNVLVNKHNIKSENIHALMHY